MLEVKHYIAKKCHEKITEMIDSWQTHYYSSGKIGYVPPPTENTKGSYRRQSYLNPTKQVQSDFMKSQEYKNIAIIVQNTPFLYPFDYLHLFDCYMQHKPEILYIPRQMQKIRYINF